MTEKTKQISQRQATQAKKTESWFWMAARGETEAEIYIYDEIGFQGVPAKQFISDLQALGEIKHITLHINSPGGSFFEGIAIFNALKYHPAAITVHVDGVAASMASVIAMVGNPVIMPANSFMMIHKPWTVAGGDADDMRDFAELLDKTEAVLIPAYPYNAMTLREHARLSLTERGFGVASYNQVQIVGLTFTHSTSDFGNIMLDVSYKSILQGWEEAPETFGEWTKKGQLSDFKIAHRVGLGGFPSLRQVREGAEYKYVTTSDKQATIALATYGELFSITRQAIINDDLSMLTDVPVKLGRAAKATVADLVYAILTTNPTLSTDNVPLFDKARHTNVLEKAGMDVASLDKARQMMRRQKEGERHLNIRPAFVLVPTAMESTASQVSGHAVLPPAVRHLRFSVSMASGHIQAQARWEILRTLISARSEVRVTRGDDGTGSLIVSDTVDRPEYDFVLPEAGHYTLTVRSINEAGLKSKPVSVDITVAPPEAPVSVDVTPGYFQVTLVPHQAIYDAATRYEFWSASAQLADPQLAETQARYLGEGTCWIKDGLRPGKAHYFYIRSVNVLGKSAFTEKQASPSEKAEDYLAFYKGKISDTHLGGELLNKMEQLREGAAKIEEVQKSWKDTEGRLNTRWSVRLEQMKNGQYCMAGFGMGTEETPEGIQSQILMAADRVAFVNPASGNSTPALVIENDQIFFREALIKKLQAVSLTSSGDPPAFKLTPDGTLTAKKADISGTIHAVNGVLENVVIKDNCTIHGQLDARQITGDIYNVQSGGINLPRGAFSWSDRGGLHVIFLYCWRNI